MNVIGDVAGEYDTMLDLIKVMPDDECIFVGDVIDRGPESNLVVEWIRKNARCVAGNHEDLCVDYVLKQNRYRSDVWLKWGGRRTLSSYGIYNYNSITDETFLDDVRWMTSLPIAIHFENTVITHAPILPDRTMLEVQREVALSNRLPPLRRPEFQVFGHLGTFQEFSDWAICLDDSRNRRLCGINLPSMRLYSVEFR